MRWTVVLLYPDYMAETFGDTFIDWTTADDAVEAVAKARENVQANQPEDCRVVAVFEGHLRDHNPE